MKLSSIQINNMSNLFKVISDPTRITILYTLKEGPLNVNRIVDKVGLTQSAVSHQLRTLKQANLVDFEKRGKEVFYRLADHHVYTIFNQALDHISE